MGTGAVSPDAARQFRLNISRYYGYQFAANLALWSPIWVLYLQQERGLSLTLITALDAPFWLVGILAEVPTGTVADRWGRKTSLIWGAGVYALALLVFGIAGTYPLLLLSYLAWAVAMALQSGADSAFLYDSLHMVGREAEFRKVSGRSQAINSVGFMLGALIGAPLAAATSLAFPIVASAAIMLLAVLVGFTFREPRHEEDAPRLPYWTTLREAFAFAFHRPAVRWMILVRASLMAAGVLIIIFTQPFLASFAVNVADFGLLTTPLRLVAIVAALVAYRLVARLGERALLYLLAAGTVGALLVLGLVDALLAFTMFGVISIAMAIAGVVTADYISRHAPQAMRATVISLAQMVFSAILFVTEPALGLIADRSSLQVMFLVCAAAFGALCAAALIAWTAAERAERRAMPEREPAGVGPSGAHR